MQNSLLLLRVSHGFSIFSKTLRILYYLPWKIHQIEVPLLHFLCLITPADAHLDFPQWFCFGFLWTINWAIKEILTKGGRRLRFGAKKCYLPKPEWGFNNCKQTLARMPGWLTIFGLSPERPSSWQFRRVAKAPNQDRRVAGRVFPLELLGKLNSMGKWVWQIRNSQTLVANGCWLLPRLGPQKEKHNIKCQWLRGHSVGQKKAMGKVEPEEKKNIKGGTAVNAHATKVIKGLNI